MAGALKPVILILVLTLPVLTMAQSRRNLADVSLEELVDIEVTSVSRKKQQLSKAAAAIYVLTSEDIRRSGVTSIPEALRMVPGLFVGRIDSSKWAVSARGFPGRFANKMLVLIDGRSVYNNFYSGVYWDQNDTLLEDVDRIEVIRGPGGTMWGANAVNGVINIITKTAQQTQGTRFTAGTGNDEQGYASLRHGGKAGSNVFYRGYGKFSHRGQMRSAAGAPFGDQWSAARAGGRVDWEATGRDTLTIHGDAYQGRASQSVYPNYPFHDRGRFLADRAGSNGGYGMARWERSYSERSALALQGYFHAENRSEDLGDLRALVTDLEFQQQFGLGARNDLLWGGGYRQMRNNTTRGATHSRSYILPEKRTDSLLSVFFQDDITVVRDRLTVSAGTKVQHNSYTGVETQPSARLLWTPTQRLSLWGAISRAVRTPVRLEHDVSLPFRLPPPLPAGAEGVLSGNRDFQSETVAAYEAGWRWQATHRVSFDLAAYTNKYRDNAVVAIGTPRLEGGPSPLLVIPFPFENGKDIRNQGLELASTWKVRRSWSIQANYSFFRELDTRRTFPGLVLDLRGTRMPRHSAQLHSSWNLTRRLSLDLSAQSYSAIPGAAVPGYLRPDVHLAYRLGEQTEISAGVQNLLDPQHPEFIAEDYVRSGEIKRAVYLRLSWGN
ncbi:MAG: TonB-dependent receptor [Bryobacteraceae bacterium]|nr:TonB-dependent receptor [Bryobacteraceae bacterium]